MKTYKPLLDNIELITQPMRELNEKFGSMVEPLSSVVSNIPSIVLSEIELHKFNIPNYFSENEIEEEKEVNINNKN